MLGITHLNIPHTASLAPSHQPPHDSKSGAYCPIRLAPASAERQLCIWSGLDDEVRDQAIHEAESVTEIDDATREVALQSIANQPHVGPVRDSFDERAGVRELRRCAAQLIVDCGLPKVFPAIVEDSGIRRKGS
jgi:hypothetical protein